MRVLVVKSRTRSFTQEKEHPFKPGEGFGIECKGEVLNDFNDSFMIRREDNNKKMLVGKDYCKTLEI